MGTTSKKEAACIAIYIILVGGGPGVLTALQAKFPDSSFGQVYPIQEGAAGPSGRPPTMEKVSSQLFEHPQFWKGLGPRGNGSNQF